MNVNTAMRHLLWKDYYQVRPALIGCMAMLACIQLLYLANQFLEENGRPIFQGTFFVALVAPTLAAIACSGLLVGQERQTRTWNWSSSLPVSWSLALTSKFIVWLAASVVMTAALLLLYALLYRIALLSGHFFPTQSIWNGEESSFVLLMLLLVPIEVFIVFNIAALLWNDTLLALVVAAIAVSIGHLLLVDTAARAVHGVAWNAPFRPQEHAATAVTLLLLAIGLATLGLCYVFRWRWTSGQLASVSLREWVRSRVGTRRSVTSLAYASGYKARAAGRGVPVVWPATMAKPSEAAMMLRHAWSSGLGIRAAIVISMLLILLYAPAGSQLYPPAITLGSLFLGAMTFGSEHSLGRYRFFADRGASWFRFLAAHVGVAFAWLMVLVAISFWLGDSRSAVANFDRSSTFLLALCSFVVAAFSSLCITNPVIATTLSCLIVFGCAICYETAHRLWGSLTGQGGLVYAALPLTVAIVLAALVYQTRRWLILERPRSVRVLVVTWLIGLFLPLWLYLTLGFLTIPKYPWPDAAVDQFHSGELPRLPRFTAELPERSTMPVTPFGAGSLPVVEQWLGVNYHNRLLHIEQYSGGVQGWLQVWQEPLKELNAELAATEAFATPNQQSLSNYVLLIEKSATLGVVAATQAGDRPSAVAAWKLNRSLLKLSEDNVDLATYSLHARITTWGMWNLLSLEDLASLQAENDLRELLPSHVDESLWTQALRTRWDLRRLSLRGAPTQDLSSAARRDVGLPIETDAAVLRTLTYYPPLRWAVERIMAQRLAQELDMLEGHPPQVSTVSTSSVAQDDPLAYQVQMLQQLEQQVLAKVAAAQ